jgi:endonuclease YncB( thermonuclease family)
VALKGLRWRFGIAAGVIAVAAASAMAGAANAIAAAAASAYAQRALPTPTGCRAELPAGDTADGGKVRAISDGRSFMLEDGRDIRLAGIEVPLPPGSGESGERAEAARAASQAARTALESIIGGQTINLRPSGAADDRYGRMLAHVYVVRGSSAQSVAHEMLGRGFARFSAQIGNSAGKNAGDRPTDRVCAAELLGRERAAREAKLGLWKLGLWGEPYYGIVGAESGAELVAERGNFTVVEGKVVSVRESAGTIYVNFGRRWSEALTVTILKRNERNFAAAGLEPRRLENRRVRVRGWVEERNGPRIEAARPEQIEIAERN